MTMKEMLTHENLRGPFKSQFELAHFAIRLARYYVHSGHEATLGDLFEQIRKNPSPSLIEDLEQADKEDS